MKSYIEHSDINRSNGKTRLSLIGWCVTDEGDIPFVETLINGKRAEPARMTRVVRQDVCNSYGLSPTSARCGFYLEYSIDEELNRVEVYAAGNEQKEMIYELTEREIQQAIRDHTIIYKVEGFLRYEESNMGSVTGWATDLHQKPLSFKIKNPEGQYIKINSRRVIREDLVPYGIATEENKFAGFMMSFPMDKSQNYTLVISNGMDEVEENLSKYFVHPRQKGILGTAVNLIRYINLENINKFRKFKKRYGLQKTIQHVFKYDGGHNLKYHQWFLGHKVSDEELAEQRETVFAYNPIISIIVPTYNTPKKYLIEMMDSVVNQSYPKWELCIADGSDSNHEARRIIREYAQKDERIKVTELDKNYGISGNTNKALELATGEYTGLFDHDDVLEPDCLYEVVNSLQGKHHDIIYTDEDKLNAGKNMYENPNMKPDFSPDLFCSHNYITHFFVVKTEIIKEIGGFRSEFDGSQDYDLMFRCIEKANSIHHIAKILYHWRMHDGSTALDPESKMYCYIAGQKAIQEHYDRIGIDAKVEMMPAPYYGIYHTVYSVNKNPLVSVIIPNYEHSDILKTCVDSLFNVNEYKNIEVIIVENNSKQRETFDYYEKVQKEHENVRVVKWEGTEFNFSAINNFGVKYAKGEILLLLNNDTEMIKPDALAEMVGLCLREDVGVVGAKLLYADNTVQHAGVVIGFSGYAGHVFTGMECNDEGFMMRNLINTNYSAVTGACLMTKKDLYEKVGGMDEEFKVAGNDVDYCLKVRATGKLVVFNAFSLWHHYESKSRGYEDSFEKMQRFEKEIALFQSKWKDILVNGDPYYNKNFRIEDGPFVLR